MGEGTEWAFQTATGESGMVVKEAMAQITVMLGFSRATEPMACVYAHVRMCNTYENISMCMWRERMRD